MCDVSICPKHSEDERLTRQDPRVMSAIGIASVTPSSVQASLCPVDEPACAVQVVDAPHLPEGEASYAIAAVRSLFDHVEVAVHTVAATSCRVLSARKPEVR